MRDKKHLIFSGDNILKMLEELIIDMSMPDDLSRQSGIDKLSDITNISADTLKYMLSNTDIINPKEFAQELGEICSVYIKTKL